MKYTYKQILILLIESHAKQIEMLNKIVEMLEKQTADKSRTDVI